MKPNKSIITIHVLAMKILKLHFNSVILNVLNFGLIYIILAVSEAIKNTLHKELIYIRIDWI